MVSLVSPQVCVCNLVYLSCHSRPCQTPYTLASLSDSLVPRLHSPAFLSLLGSGVSLGVILGSVNPVWVKCWEHKKLQASMLLCFHTRKHHQNMFSCIFSIYSVYLYPLQANRHAYVFSYKKTTPEHMFSSPHYIIMDYIIINQPNPDPSLPPSLPP